MTTTVVVLTPPAVEPGLPPMNMRITVRSRPPSVMAAVSMVLNPAVRAVTEAKREERSVAPGPIPASTPFRSVR